MCNVLHTLVSILLLKHTQFLALTVKILAQNLYISKCFCAFGRSLVRDISFLNSATCHI